MIRLALANSALRNFSVMSVFMHSCNNAVHVSSVVLNFFVHMSRKAIRSAYNSGMKRAKVMLPKPSAVAMYMSTEDLRRLVWRRKVPLLTSERLATTAEEVLPVEFMWTAADTAFRIGTPARLLGSAALLGDIGAFDIGDNGSFEAILPALRAFGKMNSSHNTRRLPLKPSERHLLQNSFAVMACSKCSSRGKAAQNSRRHGTTRELWNVVVKEISNCIRTCWPVSRATCIASSLFVARGNPSTSISVIKMVPSPVTSRYLKSARMSHR
mmetsp:Transcript_84134/g.243218  ORF Transcript_84134/g.243218 Transcript_84134/m.243218 type:complete len:269 (-) Transcript_84134:1192-1998(-)